MREPSAERLMTNAPSAVVTRLGFPLGRPRASIDCSYTSREPPRSETYKSDFPFVSQTGLVLTWIESETRIPFPPVVGTIQIELVEIFSNAGILPATYATKRPSGDSAGE